LARLSAKPRAARQAGIHTIDSRFPDCVKMTKTPSLRGPKARSNPVFEIASSPYEKYTGSSQ
ncbi:MAG: hypothetical protein Q8O01_07030, partial [Candidatus Omnitrophota bacterium]|nr:hypothetical protein [Candidatus Omnitrophota bacterium]